MREAAATAGQVIEAGGRAPTLEEVVRVAREPDVDVRLPDEARAAVARARGIVESAVERGERIYGVTTGFGRLAEVVISPEQRADLQHNLVRSHASGVGEPLPDEVVRAVMFLRAHALARGASGCRLEVVERLLTLLNRNILPVVPSVGSVGASGDLAPLAHVALALIGEGEVRVDGRRRPTAEAFAELGIEPLVLQAKEGLALINGTQATTALGVLALLEVEAALEAAECAGAMTLEALRGTPEAFREEVHRVRPHPGQAESGRRLRRLLEGSEIRESHRHGDPRVQDAYSLRCMPQVHGAARQALAYVRSVLETEVDSVTDNPLIFAAGGGGSEDAGLRGGASRGDDGGSRGDDGGAGSDGGGSRHDDGGPGGDDGGSGSDGPATGGTVISAGNFHAQVVAAALDFLCIAAADLASICERRIERLLNPDLSGLPAFLAPRPGLESGFMIAQVTAVDLLGELRVLAHPASVDSAPTSANQEDHVSMGMAAGRKARRVAEMLPYVVAVELLCAAQALEHRRPLRSSPAVERIHQAVRERVPVLERDRELGHDLERLRALVASGELETERLVS